MICVKLFFIYLSATSPGLQWESQLCDSVNSILDKNGANIYVYPSPANDENTLPVYFINSDSVPAHGVGFIGEKVVMYNQTGEMPYKLFTHEFLHALGLNHTFGFCPVGCDDGIEDTPHETQNCADTCSRNVMGYNKYQDYISPGQISALHQHLVTDWHYSGIYLADFGISVAKFNTNCSASVVDTDNNCTSVMRRRFDFSGREITGEHSGFFVAEIIDCNGSVSLRKFHIP